MNRRVHAICQGQTLGRCSVTRRAEVATRAGTVISLARMVAVVALARSLPVVVAAVRVRLRAMTASTSQAALAVNLPEGKVRQGGVLQVGVDVFDDRVAAVGFVRAHGVQVGGVGGGEEGVEAPGVEQGALPGGLLLLGVQVEDAPPGARARVAMAFLTLGSKRTVTDTSAPPRSAAPTVGAP